MVETKTLIWALNSGATLASAMIFGHCNYISVVECTARRNLPDGKSMIDHYQKTFPLAKTYSQMLGAIPTLLSLASFYLDPRHPQAYFMLAGGLTILLLGPFTGLFILPTNKLLLDGENPKKKGDAWIQEKLTTWKNLHSVRTVICSVSALLYVYGLSL